MSGRNHDSVPTIISGFSESTRFMELAFLARILCRFNDIIRKLCCGLSCLLFCSLFGEEVCSGEPGCVALPVVFIDMLKLSKTLEVSKTSDSNSEMEKLGSPQVQQIQLTSVCAW